MRCLRVCRLKSLYSTTVSKQLKEQGQKQDGCGPAASIVTLQPSVLAWLCRWWYIHLILCVCVALGLTAPPSSSVRLVWNNRTWTHTHGGSEDSCIPIPRRLNCATHTSSGQRNYYCHIYNQYGYNFFHSLKKSKWMCKESHVIQLQLWVTGQKACITFMTSLFSFPGSQILLFCQSHWCVADTHSPLVSPSSHIGWWQ